MHRTWTWCGTNRTLPPEQVVRWVTILHKLNGEVAAIHQAQIELKKGENMIEHEKEMFSRRARTWFRSE